MSIIRAFQIACNGPECYEAWQPAAEDIHSVARQRKAAKAAGWRVAQPGGQDYCWRCIAKSNTIIDINW